MKIVIRLTELTIELENSKVERLRTKMYQLIVFS